MRRSFLLIVVAVLTLLANATLVHAITPQPGQAFGHQNQGPVNSFPDWMMQGSQPQPPPQNFGQEQQFPDHGHAHQNPDHAPDHQRPTEVRTVQREVQVYNPQTGQYETRTVEEAVVVPFQGGGGLGGAGQAANNTFLATIVNNRNEVLTVNVNGQERRLNPGQSWAVRATDGQAYGYWGDPRQIGGGRSVGGVTMQGQFSANQPFVNIGGGGGGGGGGPAPNFGAFTVTFNNNGNERLHISAANQSQDLNPGGSWQVNVSDGQTYSYNGPGRQWVNPDGTMAGVGGALAMGTFSSNQRVINLGGGGGGGAGPVPVPHTFMVTIINDVGELVTVNVNNQDRQLNPGQNWQVRVSEGQTYTYSGQPRVTGPGQMVGGATAAGKFTANEKVVHLGGGGGGGGGVGPVPVPGPGPQNPLTGSFQVTFTNTAAGPVVLKLFDTQRQLVATRTLQVNQSFSASATFGYTYEQEGPSIFQNGFMTSASASGGISPSNPNINLR